MSPAKAEYGYDAPFVLIAFAVIGTLLALGAAFELTDHHSAAALRTGFVGLFFLAQAGSFFYTTRKGKFQVWQAVLDDLRLSGDERVLDMGCGRGAVLIAVARRLTSGHVTGIDLWSTKDQSGNARDVTLRNAAIEDVQSRVDVRTGDMRSLPFDDGAFDVVVSSMAIHNINPTDERAKAVREAWRVLKPGGRLVITDIRATRAYEGTLRALGANDVVRRRLGWRFWWGNPFAATTLLLAAKPALSR